MGFWGLIAPALHALSAVQDSGYAIFMLPSGIIDVTQLKTVQDPETGETHEERVEAHVWHCSLSLRADEG